MVSRMRCRGIAPRSAPACFMASAAAVGTALAGCVLDYIVATGATGVSKRLVSKEIRALECELASVDRTSDARRID